jgi:hypothetical protein
MNQVSVTNEMSTQLPKSIDASLETATSSKASQAALIKSLVDGGLNQQGINSLNREQLGQLLGLLQRGDKTQALVARMFNAVSEHGVERVPTLLSTLSTYGGSLPVLNEFLFRVSSYDPFEATSRAQILYLPADQLPTSRGASGHVLVGTTYCAYDRGAPADSIGYFSKKQAIAKIFEAFNQDKFNAETRTETKARRTRVLREELYSVTLDDLTANPKLKDEFHSPLLVRNLAVYQELRKVIENYNEQIGSLLHAGVVTLPNKGSLKVSQDAGRQLLGWFEDHLKENQNVPEGIKIAYENLRDPDIFLSAQEEREWLRGMLAYQRLHTYIDKSVALGGMAGDLKVFDTLDQNDPLRLDSAVIRARQEVQKFSEAASAEISISEYAKVIELSGLVDFRRAVNSRILAAYGAEFTAALDYFNFVTFKDGKRLPDSFQESVPMDRLKEHVLGAKIGVAQSHFGEDKKQALLGQRDFRAIAEAHNLFRITNDQDKALIAWPIHEFRQMVRGVMVAYRKAQDFDKQLSAYLASDKGSGKEVNREAVGETLKDWKPTLMVGTKWLPAEYLIDERGHGETLDLRELIARAKDRHLGGLGYGKHKIEIERQIESGLLADKFEEFVAPLQEKASKLVPATVYADLLDRATRVVAHPMIETGYNTALYNLRNNYLDDKDLLLVKELLAAEPTLQKLSADYLPQLGELLDYRRNLRGYSVMKGEFKRDENGLNISFSRLNHETMFQPQQVGILTIHDPARSEIVRKHLEQQYISIDELAEGWLDKLKFICSNKARDLLLAEGFKLVDTDTFRAAQHLRQSKHTLVNKDFAKKIEQLYAKRKDRE